MVPQATLDTLACSTLGGGLCGQMAASWPVQRAEEAAARADVGTSPVRPGQWTGDDEGGGQRAASHMQRRLSDASSGRTPVCLREEGKKAGRGAADGRFGQGV